jgi:hypothetical protein
VALNITVHQGGVAGEEGLAGGQMTAMPQFFDRLYLRTLVGFIGLAFLHLILACSFTARQWQATAVTDFRSVAGKWDDL